MYYSHVNPPLITHIEVYTAVLDCLELYDVMHIKVQSMRTRYSEMN